MSVTLKDLVIKTRSYRRFYQDIEIETQNLLDLVELARLSASPRNRQALKYIIENRPAQNAEIFKHVTWAGALPEWDGPEDGERPSAYIIIMGDDSLQPPVHNAYHDAAYGIAAQSIMLGATELELGGCMIVAVKRKPLSEYLQLPEYLQILCVLALGKPKEHVVIEQMPPDGNYNYRRDEHQTHFVPKRSLQDIIIQSPIADNLAVKK